MRKQHHPSSITHPMTKHHHPSSLTHRSVKHHHPSPTPSPAHHSQAAQSSVSACRTPLELQQLPSLSHPTPFPSLPLPKAFTGKEAALGKNSPNVCGPHGCCAVPQLYTHLTSLPLSLHQEELVRLARLEMPLNTSEGFGNAPKHPFQALVLPAAPGAAGITHPKSTVCTFCESTPTAPAQLSPHGAGDTGRPFQEPPKPGPAQQEGGR